MQVFLYYGSTSTSGSTEKSKPFHLCFVSFIFLSFTPSRKEINTSSSTSVYTPTRMSATAPVVKEVPEETQIAELKCTLADLKANAKDSGESLQVCATHRYFYERNRDRLRASSAAHPHLRARDVLNVNPCAGRVLLRASFPPATFDAMRDSYTDFERSLLCSHAAVVLAGDDQHRTEHRGPAVRTAARQMGGPEV